MKPLRRCMFRFTVLTYRPIENGIAMTRYSDPMVCADSTLKIEITNLHSGEAKYWAIAARVESTKPVLLLNPRSHVRFREQPAAVWRAARPFVLRSHHVPRLRTPSRSL